jgi:hypothetical protein
MMTKVLSELHISGQFSVSIKPCEVTPNQVLVTDYIQTNVLITMGEEMQHLDLLLDKGVSSIVFDHNFRPIVNKYVNQSEWTEKDSIRYPQMSSTMKEACIDYHDLGTEMIKSHVIVWVYVQYPEPDAEVGCTDIPIRSCLIGTKAITLESLLAGLCDRKGLEITCEQNFCDSSATVHFSKRDDDSVEHIKSMQTLAKKIPSLVASHSIFKSPLSTLDKVLTCVGAQQGILKTYNMQALNMKVFQVADPMGTQFLGFRTYTQLHDFSMCFTDVTYMAKSRVVSLPFELLMRHTYAACVMNGLCIASQVADFVVSNFNPAKVATQRALLHSLLTNVIMDTKQSEYFSDYCLGRVDPTETRPTDKADSKKFSVKNANGRKTFFVFNQTEDQRQICTGEHGTQRSGTDDCETLTTLMLALLRAYIEFQAKLVKKGIWDEYVSVRTDKLKLRQFVETNELLHTVVEEVMPSKMWNLGDKSKSKMDRAAYVVLLLQLAHDMSCSVVCSIGTANAAAVGKPPHLSGHCYLMMSTASLYDNYLTTKVDVLEGTGYSLPEEDKDADEKNQANLLSQMLFEATRTSFLSGGEPCCKDIGHGLGISGGKQFYKEVYIMGDSVVTSLSNNMKTKTIGASITEVKAGKVEHIPVDYSMLQAHTGIRAKAVQSLVHKMVRAETVPAWSEERWIAFMDIAYQCRSWYYQRHPFDPNTQLRVIFSHQAVGLPYVVGDQNRGMRRLQLETEALKQFFKDGIPKHSTTLHQIRMAANGKDRYGTDLDIKATCNLVGDSMTYIELESIVTVAEMVLCTCIINKTNVSRASQGLHAWVDAIKSHNSVSKVQIPRRG